MVSAGVSPPSQQQQRQLRQRFQNFSLVYDVREDGAVVVWALKAKETGECECVYVVSANRSQVD